MQSTNGQVQVDGQTPVIVDDSLIDDLLDCESVRAERQEDSVSFGVLLTIDCKFGGGSDVSRPREC